MVNTPAEPVPVKPAERELFQTTIRISMSNTASSASASFAVPIGKHLVIENLSGRGGASGITAVFVTQFSNAAVLPVTRISTGFGWRWVGTTPTKVRFTPGNVSVVIYRPTPPAACTTCSGQNYVTITGYMIPA